MRSVVLSMVLGLGTLGLALATPTQVRADDYRGPAFTSGYMPVAHYWRGYTHWRRGRSFYPGFGYGYGYGYYGGYYPYGGYPYGVYGGYGNYGGYYNRRFYGGGYYPWGYRNRVMPFGRPYYGPGYFW